MKPKTERNPKGAGQDCHEPTPQGREQVKSMSGYGIPQDEIARLLEIDPKTLRKYYRDELDTGMTEANAAVAESLYKSAVEDRNVTAAIWWTKSRMGWKERVEVTGKDGGPINMRNLSDDELDRRITRLAAESGISLGARGEGKAGEGESGWRSGEESRKLH